MIFMESASNLKKLCSDHSISCTALAGLAGVGRSTAHNLLTGRITAAMRERAENRLAKTLPDFLADRRGLSVAKIDEILSELFQGENQPAMSNKKLALTPSEIKWFGLPKDPFRDDPADLSEVFVSPPMRGLIDRVIDAIHYQGFISITAPIGGGKTILKKLIQTRLEDGKVHIIWPESFEMKRVTAMQIAEAIFKYFNPSGRVPRGAVNRPAVVKTLLQKQYRAGARVMIGIDESHRLHDETLSSLKNFLEMSSGGFQRYLGVVLLGQKSFTGRLDEAQFQELLERITPLELPPFTPHAKEYLDHRLKLVGVSTETLFDREAVDLICSNAETPLQLGNIANEALRLSKKMWQNKTVIGSAIKEKMFFKDLPQQVRKHSAK